MMNDVMIAAVVPYSRYTNFDRKAYYHRVSRGANDNGFEDVLKRAIRMSKPSI